MLEITDARSVTELLRHRARSEPDREAFHYLHDVVAMEGSSLTFGDLDRAAAAVALRLSKDFKAGDRLLLLYSFGPGFAVALLACLYAGMVAVPSPLPGRYHHERRRVLSIARNSGAAAVLTDDTNISEIGEWMQEQDLGDLPLLSIDRVTEDPGAFSPQENLGRQTLAMLQYTSGSTGNPKGVMLTHGNLLRNVDTLIQAFGDGEHHKFGGWLPHFHDMGLIQLLYPLFLGSRCVLMSPFSFIRRPHAWLKMIDEFDITLSVAPNFAYELCCRRVTDEQLSQLDLSRWRCALNGSEPIHPGTLTDFADRFGPAGFRTESQVPCYGLAESTLYVSGNRFPRITEVDVEMLEDHKIVEASHGRPRRGLVSCGVPRNVDLQIVDPQTGHPLPTSTVGEIWLRGDSIAAGYWDNPEATTATFGGVIDGVDGRYLRTGDLGALHDGEVYVTGRIKEMITVHGRNLYPQDIEHELRAAHSELIGGVGAVFTVPGHGPDPSLIVTHEVKVRLSEEELNKLARSMRQTVAREMGATPSCVVLLRPGAVRRTTSGKIQRDAMRTLFHNGELKARWVHGDTPGQHAGGRAGDATRRPVEEAGR